MVNNIFKWQDFSIETVFIIYTWLKENDDGCLLSYKQGGMKLLKHMCVPFDCEFTALNELCNIIILLLSSDYKAMSPLERQVLSNFLKVFPEMKAEVSQNNLLILEEEVSNG